MLPKLTRNYTTGTYDVPKEWISWDWINNFENYPDPEHLTFAREYDWEHRQKSGVLSRYIKTIEGHTTTCVSSTGTKFTKTFVPKPYIYYLFALAAVELINNPKLYRSARENSLNGAFVVNYANSINVSSLSFIPERTNGKKYIIGTEYGALLARVFNVHSGVQQEDWLRTELREDRKSFCPNCYAVFELLSKKCWTPKDPDYKEQVKVFIEQIEYIRHRNENG